MTAKTRETQHQQGVRKTAELSTTDIVKALKLYLGPQLLAVTIGVDPKTIERWEKSESQPSHKHERRLRNTYQVFEMLSDVEEQHTIRAWFMGMNPQLDDLSAAELIAQDRFPEVAAAARAFRSGG